jgi:hypothetical protein
MDALMILVGGLLGSSHCVGMCGGFVLTLGSARPGLAANLGRQLSYSLGRVFTYAAGGAAAGYGGWRLVHALGPAVNLQALLAIAAGLLLVHQGLGAAGVWRRRPVAGSTACRFAGPFAALLTAPGWRPAFVAGLVNGLLPCGLVYAYLALASSAGDLLRGSATMALFGLGTVPVLVLTGCGGSILSLASRRRLFRVAAWCLVLTGVLSLVRGLGFVQLPGLLQPPGCPLCE